VLITGGGTGLGLGIARALHAAGMELVVVGRRPEPLQAAAQELDARAIPWDIGRPEGLLDLTGPIDHVVLNAGNDVNAPLGDWTRAHFEQTYRVHVVGHALLAQDWVSRGRPGTLTAICSTLAERGAPGKAAYAAAKAAQLSLIRSLAREAAPTVRANALLVGVVPTPMSTAPRGAAPHLPALEALHPLGLGTPGSVGHAVLHLIQNPWITGAALHVDGGLSL
jgi:gluconate 5-dehydrogenase